LSDEEFKAISVFVFFLINKNTTQLQISLILNDLNAEQSVRNRFNQIFTALQKNILNTA